MSSSAALFISTLDTIDQVAHELSATLGWPLSEHPAKQDEERWFDGQGLIAGIEVWLSLSSDGGYSADSSMLFPQYQFQVDIKGSGRVDQMTAGCVLYRALRERGRYRLLLTDDLQWAIDEYVPGEWDSGPYVEASLWKERGAAAGLTLLADSRELGSSAERSMRAAFRLFADELAALGAVSGNEANHRGAWHRQDGGLVFRTDAQVEALAAFEDGWVEPALREMDGERLPGGVSPVALRERWVMRIDEPGVTGSRWKYLRTHVDGQSSIRDMPESAEFVREFSSVEEGGAWLGVRGYKPTGERELICRPPAVTAER
jgi:hypothetical protein